MLKISYLMPAIILCSSVLIQPAVAQKGNYSDTKNQHAEQSSGKVNWNSSRWGSGGEQKAQPQQRRNSGGQHQSHARKKVQPYTHWRVQSTPKPKAAYKSGHYNKGNPYYYGKPRYKAKQPVYYPYSKARYYGPKYKPYYKRHYYTPRYVYLKPYPRYRYYGYYPYRGFHWPFVNVNFVVNLSNRQMERHHQAVYTALDAPVGDVATWYDNGRHGSIVILREGVDSSGNICKQYRQTIRYRGNVNTQTVTSCLSPDGYWVTP
ncbi:MAG: hypothetical protein COB93_06215 [Sneathiella sp.]|nr:MAG: hypothetical protein COB93_06215 [Sneathiella sp.]